MNKTSIETQNRLPVATASTGTQSADHPSENASRIARASYAVALKTTRQPEPWRAQPATWLGRRNRLVSLARVAPMFACAGVLTLAMPAAAQDAPPAQQPAQGATPAPSPEAGPPAPGTQPAAGAQPAPVAQSAPGAQPAPAQPAPVAQPAPGAQPAPVTQPAPAEAAPGAVEEEVYEEGAYEEVYEDDDYTLDDSGMLQTDLGEMVVTGFRKSLDVALDKKQQSFGQVDAIVAEDMADFPDLNLAESLQRIPGISITRSNGQGNQVSVRGLSGRYTRVRINGMETRAGVGTSNGRAFDFSMFASELFNGIVVRKTASADVDEGSLGATIDLNTGRPFNFKKGLTTLAAVEGGYNTLSGAVNPRLTGLISYRDPEGFWGATASAAFSTTRNDVESSNTVRWHKARFNSVKGETCNPDPDLEMDPGCLEVSDAFHARIPRYAYSEIVGRRVGFTGGFQIRPTDKTEIRLEGLYANRKTERDFKTIEVLFRGNEGSMDVTDYTLQEFPERFGVGNNTLTALSVDNAWVRSETNNVIGETDFHQLSLALEHEFTDEFYLKAMAGTSRNIQNTPRSTTLMYDDRDYDGYSYDYDRDDELPELAFNGPDVTNGANFDLTELRDQVNRTVNTFDTLELNLYWDIDDALMLSAGVNYKVGTLDTRQVRRDGSVCGLGLYDCDEDNDGSNELIGAPGSAALSDQYEYPGEVGSGSASRWAAPSLDGWTKELNYYAVPLSEDEGRVRTVEERNLGAFAQLAGEVELGAGDMRLNYQGGLRVVQTRQSSGGYVSGVFADVDRDPYTNVLPALNVGAWLADDLVVRLAAARVMARPALSNLSPGGSVDSFNFTVNYQNPQLDPTKATALDTSIEWYFQDESLLALALFYKNLDSFALRESRDGTFASTGLPRSVISPTSPADQDLEGTCGGNCWEISELTNGPGATIKGLEVAFQAPLTALLGKDLPPVIDGLGLMANFTYVDSDTEYDFSGNQITERLTQLSNTAFNGTLYYEDSKFGARVSVANRSDYLQSGPNRSGNLWQFVEGNTRLDFSSRYNLTEELELTLEALNLTNTPFNAKVDVDANRRLQYDRFGTNILIGARYKR